MRRSPPKPEAMVDPTAPIILSLHDSVRTKAPGSGGPGLLIAPHEFWLTWKVPDTSQGQQPRLYVSFPLALAAAIGLQPGDHVQWELLDRGELHLVRLEAPPPTTRCRARQN